MIQYKQGEFSSRQWGSWRVDAVGDHCIKKTIIVNPGQKISLQSHKHRTEKWEIIEGTAEVTLDGKTALLSIGQSVEIPCGSIHRLGNPGAEILKVIEIQSGEILDENDIIRYEDMYGRETIKDIVFVADLDGTLAPARLPMTTEFTEFFEDFIANHAFYIVSGSDYKKICEQMPERIVKKVKGVFASMGNEYYENGNLIYKNDFQFDPDLFELLEKYRNSTRYPNVLRPNYIEKRCGMLNFSVLGRDCTYQERTEYKQWDEVHHEREKIKKELQQKYPQYDVSIGGNISIDIVPHGFGKEQLAEKLRKIHPKQKIVFLGDRTYQGGNDYSLAQALKKLENAEVVAVRNPDDSLVYLRKFN